MSAPQAFTHLIAIVVHGHQAQQMVHVAALAKFAHQLRLEAFVLQDAFVTRGHDQPLHADGAVLKEPTKGLSHSNGEGVKLGMAANPFGVHVRLTSSGATLIFSAYLLTTSSGFFPSHGNKPRGGKNADWLVWT